MSAPSPGYVPAVSGLAAEYYRRAAATGQVHLRRCGACAAMHHPPRHYCPACASHDLSFVASPGRGTVYSAVVAHRVFGPAPVPEVPYVVVTVELDEGPRILGTARGAPAEAWTIGRRARIEVEPAGEAFAVLRVVLDDGPPAP